MGESQIKVGDVVAWGSLNVARLIELLLNTYNNPGNWWRRDCLFVYEKQNCELGLFVKHEPSNRYLRHSKGPYQHHFWDVYGDDYQTPEVAMLALSQAPAPALIK